MEKVGFKPRRLVGFSPSPNLEVIDLERVLKIEFPAIPTKVFLTPRNWLVFRLYGLFSPNFRYPQIHAAEGLQAYCGGYYLPNYNTFFIMDRDPLTSRHENMHAYEHLANPQIQQSYKSPHKKEAIDLEEFYVARHFDEGVAEYGSIRTGLRMDVDEQRKKATSRHNLLMCSDPKAENLRINRKGIERTFDILQNILNENTKLVNIDIIRRQGMTYVLSTGYYFVFLAVRELRQNELETGASLTLLIKNPPTKLEQLRNPVSYAQSLLTG